MKKLLLCALLVIPVIAGCSNQQSNGPVVATVGDEKITLSEFNKELDKIPMNMKMLVATESGKKNYLDKLIMKRLLLEEAKKKKIESDKTFQERLADIKDQLLIETLLKKEISTDVKLTDKDLKDYYDKNKENFKRGKEINTRHILVKSESEAKQILGRLQKGENFVELAKQYSIEPNAKVTGGEIGYHPKGSLVPEYEDAAFKLSKVGQTSGIVKTQFGYHIIRLEGVKPPAYVPFDEVKEFIKQRLTQEKQGETLQRYLDQLKKESKITINESLLKSDKENKPEKQAQPETGVKSEAAPKVQTQAPGKTGQKEGEAPKK
jgi:peptidyl-prolyl cis-trans isomerase C